MVGVWDGMLVQARPRLSVVFHLPQTESECVTVHALGPQHGMTTCVGAVADPAVSCLDDQPGLASQALQPSSSIELEERFHGLASCRFGRRRCASATRKAGCCRCSVKRRSRSASGRSRPIGVLRDIRLHCNDSPMDATEPSAPSEVPASEARDLAGRDLATVSTHDLLALYGQIISTLRARNVVRSENSPVGDYAEWLVSRAFGFTLAGNSSSGFDALGPDDTRYQVKGRRITPSNRSRQLGAIRGLVGPDPFDVLIAVLFTPDLSVDLAVSMPIAAVRREAKPQSHVNGWRLVLTDAVLAAPDVTDITSQIRAASLEPSVPLE